MLFAGVGSFVGELAAAVLVIVAPLATLALTLTTSVKAATAPAGSEAMLQLTVPPAPTAGLVHEKAGPVFWARETNVVPAGRVSVTVAGLGVGRAAVGEIDRVGEVVAGGYRVG